MRLKQIAVIAMSCVLVFALYLVRNKPVQESPFENFITEARDSLTSSELATIASVEEEASGSEQVGAQLRNLEQAWDSVGNKAVSAMYAYRIALKERSLLAWKHSGEQLTEAFRYAREKRMSPNLIHFFSVKATESFQNALSINEEDIDARIGLAIAFTDGEQEVMKGVQLLLEVIEQEPDNIRANQILGRCSMISGQYEKAIDRLETVLEQEPENVEALYYLGEAYNGLGQAEMALDYYERAQQFAEEPAISNDIGNKIKKLKNKN